jgi:hypothetical protein
MANPDDPNGYYGNVDSDAMAQQAAMTAATYGDQQAAMTHMRAAYGPGPMAMMAGMTMGGGAYQGGQNAMTAIGGQIMPISYQAPSMVMPAYGGMYQQQGGLFRNMGRAAGLYNAPFGMNESGYRLLAAEDVGERLGGGVAAAATMAGGLLAGATVGRPIGGFIGGALGSVAGPLGSMVGAFVGQEFGSYAMGMSGAGAVMDAVGQRRDIHSYLETSGFRNFTASGDSTDPRRGSGISRQGREQVTDYIRKLDSQDPMLDTAQLTDIMKKGSELGLFAGAANIDDFKRRFKDVVENVKTVAKTLHTTLDEGLKVMRELKAVGIEGMGVHDVSMMAGSLGKVAGRTGAEMVGIGLQGAELYRGTGVSMSIGMEANMMNIANVRAARDAGILSQEAVSQMGGEEAFAQHMTAGGLGFTQSSMGRGFSASYFNAKGAGTGLDQGALMGMLTDPNATFFGQANKSAMNLADPRALIKFEATQEQRASEVGKQLGGFMPQAIEMSALMLEAKQMAKDTGDTSKEAVTNAFKVVAKQQNKTESEIALMLGMVEHPEKFLEGRQRAAQAQRNDGLANESIQNSVFYQVGARLSDATKPVVDLVARPLSRLADTVGEGTVTAFERYGLGLERANVGGVNYAPFGGGPASLAGTANLDRSGPLATSAGSALAESLRSGLLGADLQGKIRRGSKDRVGPNDTILTDKNSTLRAAAAAALVNPVLAASLLAGSAFTTDETESIDNQSLQTGMRRSLTLSVSEMQADQMAKDGRLKELQARHVVESVVSNKSAFANVMRANGPEEFFQAFYGKDKNYSNLTREEVANIRFGIKGMGDLEKKMESFRGAGISAAAAMDGKAVADLQAYSGQLASAKEGALSEISPFGGMSEFATGAFENILQARSLHSASEAALAKGDRAEARRLQGEADVFQSNAVHAQTSLAGAGVNSMRVVSDVSMLVNSNRASIADNADRGRMALNGMAQTQTTRGTTVLVGALRSEEYSGSLDRAGINKVTALATSLDEHGGTALLAMSNSDADMLKKSGAVGTKLAGLRDSMTALQALPSSASPEQIIEAVKSSVPKEQAGEVVRSFMQEGQSVAMQKAYSLATSSAAGDTAASAANARGGVVGTEQGTANEELSRQTAINTQIAVILTALAARLKL